MVENGQRHTIIFTWITINFPLFNNQYYILLELDFVYICCSQFDCCWMLWMVEFLVSVVVLLSVSPFCPVSVSVDSCSCSQAGHRWEWGPLERKQPLQTQDPSFGLAKRSDNGLRSFSTSSDEEEEEAPGLSNIGGMEAISRFNWPLNSLHWN